MAKDAMATLIANQIMRLRAAVLLATLVGVPLLAALGTGSSRWAGKDTTATIHVEDQQARPQTPEQARNDDHNNIEPSALNQPARPQPIDRQTKHEAQSDKDVIRRWAQDEPAQEPRRDSSRVLAATQEPPSPFRAAEQQLRDLGATSYLLEHWGEDETLYRFHCRMSIDGLTDYNQHFESVAEDPVDAMHAVMEQVHRWKASLAARDLVQ